jgi:hypothetical protein
MIPLQRLLLQKRCFTWLDQLHKQGGGGMPDLRNRAHRVAPWWVVPGGSSRESRRGRRLPYSRERLNTATPARSHTQHVPSHVLCMRCWADGCENWIASNRGWTAAAVLAAAWHYSLGRALTTRKPEGRARFACSTQCILSNGP